MGSPGKNTGVGCHFLLQGSSPPRDRTYVSCIVRQVLYHCTTREALYFSNIIYKEPGLWAMISNIQVDFIIISILHLLIEDKDRGISSQTSQIPALPLGNCMNFRKSLPS